MEKVTDPNELIVINRDFQHIFNMFLVDFRDGVMNRRTDYTPLNNIYTNLCGINFLSLDVSQVKILKICKSWQRTVTVFCATPTGKKFRFRLIYDRAAFGLDHNNPFSNDIAHNAYGYADNARVQADITFRTKRENLYLSLTESLDISVVRQVSYMRKKVKHIHYLNDLFTCLYS
jgi:hypothetical protein